jgi:hypothetical protein
MTTPLAVVQRRRRNAQVEVDVLLGAILLENDAAVLRQPALGDVQVAHDLEASHQRRPHLLRQPQLLRRTTVDAVCATIDFLFLRLDVDVARRRKSKRPRSSGWPAG